MNAPPSLSDAQSLHEGGNLAEAEAAYRTALASSPDRVEILDPLGVVLAQQGRLDEAYACLSRALTLAPDDTSCLNNLATLLSQMNRIKEAEPLYVRAVDLTPDNAKAWYNLATVRRRLGRPHEAVESCEKALSFAPGDPDTLSALGNALNDLGRTDDALAAFDKAVDFAPNHAVAHNNRGTTLKSVCRYTEAIEAFRHALALQPDYGDAANNLAECLKEVGRARDAIPFYEKATAAEPRHAGIRSNALLVLHDIDGLDPVGVLAAHQTWESHHGAPKENQFHFPALDRTAERRLRIGYVSSDMRRHSVAYFFEPLLVHHDKSAVEVFCYANVASPDEVTKRLHALADAWRDVRGKSDHEVAQKIHDDKIDILIDLNGHTAGSRLGVFTYKPAPLQITYLGYPGTTGLSTMDARFVDSITDPVAAGGKGYTEDLVRLPKGFLTYRPDENAPAPTGPAPGAPLTFCSANNLAKVTDKVVSAWSAILAALPDARLVMKTKPLSDPGVRDDVARRFAEHGIDGDRLDLMGWLPTGEHLDIYNHVHIALDTFPYNGTTTTCEALWMGVPVVTVMGNTHASRVGASLLSRVGHPGLVANSVDDYIETAISLAKAADKLHALKAGLRDRMAASVLMDGAGFTRTFEQALREQWAAKVSS